MSYRELRNFTEIMRTLGYPRLISVENFRTPNFELVADILYWLVHRYDPNLQLPYKVHENEEERVEFLKLTAEVMYSKARIKLNTKKLYSADGYAVKELLKISSLLYESLKKNFSEEDPFEGQELNLSSKVNELKNTRALATEITNIGVSMYDLLGSEVELREARQQAIAKNYNNEEIERNIRKTVENIQDQVSSLIQRIENLASDEQNLETKIERKKTEVERGRNRLKSFQGVRPQYLDEYERLEVELQKQYVDYLERFRNLGYLENELENIHRTEQESYEESQRYLKRMQNKQDKERGSQEGGFNRGGSPESDGFEQDADMFAANLEDEFDDGNDDLQNDNENEPLEGNEYSDSGSDEEPDGLLGDTSDRDDEREKEDLDDEDEF